MTLKPDAGIARHNTGNVHDPRGRGDWASPWDAANVALRARPHAAFTDLKLEFLHDRT